MTIHIKTKTEKELLKQAYFTEDSSIVPHGKREKNATVKLFMKGLVLADPFKGVYRLTDMGHTAAHMIFEASYEKAGIK